MEKNLRILFCTNVVYHVLPCPDTEVCISVFGGLSSLGVLLEPLALSKSSIIIYCFNVLISIIVLVAHIN